MTNYGIDDRMHEIRDIHEDFPLSFPISLLLILVGILIGIGLSFIDGFEDSLFTEFVSILITFGILDILIRAREKRQNNNIRRILSWNNGKTLSPPESYRVFFEMIILNLLQEHSFSSFNVSEFNVCNIRLRKSHLSYFNLGHSSWQEVTFSRLTIAMSHLVGSIFTKCHFRKSSLAHVDLTRAVFRHTSFSNCEFAAYMKDGKFVHCHFENVKFVETSFIGTQFFRVMFTNCDLSEVCLDEAVFLDVSIDARTKLPDGTNYDASKGIVQLERFTNRNSENFYPVPNIGLNLIPFIPGLD